MKLKKLLVVLGLVIVFVGCSEKSVNTELENELNLLRVENENLKQQLSKSDSGDNGNIELPHAKEPYYWTLDLQEAKYRFLFSEKDIDGIFQFRNFVESLAQYHHGEPVYEFNPVILAIDSYPAFLEDMLSKRSDLFAHGHYAIGDYDVSPIVYTLRNCYLGKLKFFFEHEIPEKDSNPYGSRRTSWLGQNFVTDACSRDMEEYLIEQGYESEKKAPGWNYYLKNDGVNIFEFPGYENQVIDRLPQDTKIEATVVTMYKRNDCQWIKIKYDGDKEGWTTLDLGLGFNIGI